MSVNTVFYTMAGFFAIGLGLMIGTPIIYNIYQSPLWDGVPAQGLAIRENVMSATQIIAVPLMGIPIVWGLMTAARRQQNEYSD